MLELQLFSIHLSNITFYYFSEIHVKRRELCAGENKIVKQEILSSFEV